MLAGGGGSRSAPELKPEPTSEPTPAPTPEPTPDPNLPYVERYGIEFPEEYELGYRLNNEGAIDKYIYMFDAPYFIYLKNNDTGELIPNSETESVVAKDNLIYMIEDISILPSEESGKVELSFDVNIYADNEYLLDTKVLPKGHGNAYRASLPMIFDYYTGMTLPTRSLSNNDSYSIKYSLEIDGNPVDIEFAENFTDNGFWKEGAYIGDGIWKNNLIVDSVANYRFTIPEDYDGLCFCMRKNKYGKDYEYEELDLETFSESKPWLESLEVTTPEDYYLIRISDLKAALDKENGKLAS